MKSQEAVKLRNYGDLVDRYDALLGRCFDGGPAGEIDRMPVYHMTLRGDSPAPQRWLLGAGMHGDEPAGHLALLLGGIVAAVADDEAAVAQIADPFEIVGNLAH